MRRVCRLPVYLAVAILYRDGTAQHSKGASRVDGSPSIAYLGSLSSFQAFTIGRVQDQEITKHSSSYTQALRLIKERRYEAAVAFLKGIIEEAPTFHRAYQKLLGVLQEMNQPEAAKSYFEAKLRHDPQRPSAHFGLGLIQKKQKELENAEATFRKCIQIDPEFHPAYTELIDLAPVGSKTLEQFLVDLVRKNSANAVLFYGMGYFHQKQADWNQSLQHLNRATQLKPHLWEADSSKAIVCHRSGKSQEALAVLRKMLEAAQNDNDMERQCRILGRSGVIYSDLGQYPLAVENLNRSLEMSREIGDRTGEQAYLANLGVVYGYQGKHRQALESYELAFKIASEEGDRLSAGRNLGLIGGVHLELGNFQKALDHYAQAIKTAKEVGDSASEAAYSSNTGLLHIALGDYSKALDYLQSAVSIAHRLRNPWQEGNFLWAHGYCHEQSNQHRKALGSYEAALTVFNTIGDKAGEADTLSRIGRVQSSMRQHALALQSYEQALKIAKDSGTPTVEGDILNGLGKLHTSLGNYSQAEHHYQLSLAIGNDTAVPELIWQAHAGLAAVYEKRGHLAQAPAHYRQAIDTIEKMRGNLQIAEEKAGFLQNKIEVYKNLIACLITGPRRESIQSDRAEAFHYAERARARSFLDQMAEARVQVEEGIDGGLLNRQHEIEARIARLQSQVIQQRVRKARDPGKEKALEADLAKSDEDYLNLRREIRHKHPRYAELQHPEPIRLAQTQQLLNERSLLLEYSLGESASFLFAASKTNYQVFRLPPASALLTRVTKLREAIARPGRTTLFSYLAQARSLYQDLIQPAKPLLNGKTELIIVPDGVLHHLPFEVLLKPDGLTPAQAALQMQPYLVRDYSISYVPSASILASLPHSRHPTHDGQKGFLAFADPDYGDEEPQPGSTISLLVRSASGEGSSWRLERLAQSRREVQAIARLYPEGEAALFLGDQAREEHAKANGFLSHYRIVHFATHGLLNEAKPHFSGLVLSLPSMAPEGQSAEERERRGLLPEKAAQIGSAASSASSPQYEDGLLQVYEIFNLKLKADLVVLSACETGLGKQVKGEGLLGLTRAFLYAGTPSVVVSLWKVADQSTSDLMIRFYRQLRTGKVSKAEALRQAQLEMIRGGFPHPYHWAPFVLVGRP